MTDVPEKYPTTRSHVWAVATVLSVNIALFTGIVICRRYENGLDYVLALVGTPFNMLAGLWLIAKIRR